MRFVLVLLMFAAPIIAGIILALMQVVGYRLLGRPVDGRPSFPVLFARGLLVFFVCAAVLAVVLHLGQGASNG